MENETNMEAMNNASQEKNKTMFEEKILPVLTFLAWLCLYAIVGWGVLYAAILLWCLGFFMFWNSLGKSSYQWQERMQKWYMEKIATVFKDSTCNPKIKQVIRIIIDLSFIICVGYAVVLCFLYGIIMFWCSFGKRNMKWMKRIIKWYTRRLSATIKNDYSVRMFSNEEEAEYYDLHLKQDGSLDMRYNDSKEFDGKINLDQEKDDIE